MNRRTLDIVLSVAALLAICIVNGCHRRHRVSVAEESSATAMGAGGRGGVPLVVDVLPLDAGSAPPGGP